MSGRPYRPTDSLLVRPDAGSSRQMALEIFATIGDKQLGSVAHDMKGELKSGEEHRWVRVEAEFSLFRGLCGVLQNFEKR